MYPVSAQARLDRAISVINHLTPLVTAKGLANGAQSRRFVSPPYAVSLRSFSDRHIIEITRGRKVFAATWTDDGGVHVEYLKGGDWWREVLALA